MRLGVLDIGSNSAHIRVVEAYHGAPPLPVFRMKAPTRLAESIDASGALTRAGIRRLAAALASASRAARSQQVDELIVFATATLRQATNATQIQRLIQQATAVPPTVISGEEEACLTFLAVHRWLGWSAMPLLVIDIGGGSTEIAYGRDESPDWALSLPAGAGRITREWLPEHPARPRQVKAARRAARDAFASLADRVDASATARHVIGTSKTFKQMARLCGAPPWREGPHLRRRIRRVDVTEQVDRLATLSPAERSRLPGVAAARARQLLAGAIIAEAAMTALDVKTVDVVGWAVREGILLRRLDDLADAAVGRA